MALNKSFICNYASLCLLLAAAFFVGSKYFPIVTSEEFPQVISSPSRNLCESCPSSFVCHSIVDAPASKGYCVDDCKHCLGAVCQICHSPNRDKPSCQPVESTCKKSKHCCGHSNHSSTCWNGTCKVTKGHYCWKKSVCVDDLWCHKKKCTEPKHARESDTLRPDCPQELQRILFRIMELRRRNFEIVNLIIRILRLHFPRASFSNKVEDFSDILSDLGVSASDINKLDTSTYVSSGANDDAVKAFEDISGGCPSALKRAEEELRRLEKEHQILLRILQILLARFGPPREDADYENLNTAFAGYTQNTAASSLPSATNDRTNLRDEDFFMTTVDNEGNDVTHLLRKISSLQKELDIAGIPSIVIESESIEIDHTNHISEENMKDVENRDYDNKEHEDDVNKSELNSQTPNDITVLKETGHEINEIENAQQDREERLINGNF